MDELPSAIGPYQVRDCLGQGGMGVVYLGFDPMLDRPVAIKVLKVPDEETRRRFLREARLAARVHHPHIVSIYAVGEHEGQPYLAMEFIAGRTLAQIIRDAGPVPLARKVHWLAELCAGLGHAHQNGIVHRDVKPSNLLISQQSSTLRLLDFGIAHGNEASTMTMAGMIVGTPQYMSPEQITGQSVDARSDIFSVGLVAYELISGRPAFGGENLYHVSRQIVGEQPRPLESLCPDVPLALVKVIGKCLQKDPSGRPEQAGLLEREFSALARRLDPEHTLVAPLEQTLLAQPTPRDATTALRALLRDAGEAIEQGQLTTASGLLQRAEATAPASPDVLQLRQKLQGRRLAARIQDAVSRAEDAIQGGSLEESEAAVAALAEVAPRHPDLDRLRTAHHGRMLQRQIGGLTSRARGALQQDRLDEAAALIAEALSLSPDAPEALAAQQQLLGRTRAQRVARLVSRASSALDQEDLVAARKAIGALEKLDPRHRDVERLRTRLQLLDTNDDEVSPTTTNAAVSTRAGETAVARPAAAPQPTSAPAPTPAAAPVREPGAVPALRAGSAPSKPPAKDAPGASAAPGAAARAAGGAAGGAVAAAPIVSVITTGTDASPAARAPGSDPAPTPFPGKARHTPPSAPDDVDAGLRLRDVHPASDVGVTAGPAPRAPHDQRDDADAPSTTRSRTVIMVSAAMLVLALSGGGAYLAWVRTSATTTPGAGREVPGSRPDAPATRLSETRTSSTPAPSPTGGAAASPAGAVAAVPMTGPAASVAARGDVWQAVRQLSASARYDRALSAIDQVTGAPAADQQAERRRVVEGALRAAQTARRVAEDLQRTRTPQYQQGVAAQQHGEQQQGAGRMRQAVTAYMTARTHFDQAFPGNTANATAPAAGTDAATPPTAPSEAPAPAATATAPGVDLSTWSTAEAHAVITAFAGAYGSRDIAGMRRIWPVIDPAWEAEFKEAFATKGELVCVFEQTSATRTSDQFVVTARLLTQLPDGDQRRRSLVITLEPQRDRLVISRIRVR